MALTKDNTYTNCDNRIFYLSDDVDNSSIGQLCWSLIFQLQEDDKKEAKEKADMRATLMEMNKMAAKYLYAQWKTQSGKIGYDYLKKRELSDETKKSISRSNKGRPKSFTHRKNISIALQNYWQSVPSRDEHLSMQEYLTGEKNNEVKSSKSDGE